VKKILAILFCVLFSASAHAVDIGWVDEVPTTQKVMAVENPELELSMLTRLVDDKAVMLIYAGLGPNDWRNVLLDLTYLEELTSIRTVDIHINSPGGDAFSGLSLSNMVQRFKDRGFKLNMYASGLVASAAVPVFVVGSERIAAKSTIFMVHEASIWKYLASESQSDIENQRTLLKTLSDQYRAILAEHSNISVNEWKEKERCTTYFTAEEAIKWGIVDRIE